MSANEVEQKARNMGWLPKEQFRGRVENWVDADKYVERGEQFVPFLQATNRKLEGELTAVRGEVNTLQTTLKEATETIQALKEFRTELNKERVEELKGNLVEGIKAAREEGDVEKEEQLRDKLADARQAAKEPEKKEPPRAQREEQQPDVTKLPEWQDFVAANPWWNEDPVMRSASVAIGQQLAAAGKLNGMNQAQRFAEIAKETKARFGMDEEPRQQSRVEGGRGGGGRQEQERSGEKTFNDLPGDVKVESQRFEERLIGPKKLFKDRAAYQKYYADEYFRVNPNG